MTSVAFFANGEILMTGLVFESGSTYDGKRFERYIDEPVRLWKAATGAEVRKLDHRATTLASAGDEKCLLVVTMRTGTRGINRELGMINETTGTVSLLDVSTGKTRMSVAGYGGAAALSADGRLLATALGSDLHVGVKVRHRDTNSDAGALRIWETLTGHKVLRFPVEPSVMAFAPDGRHLLFGTRAGVCAW